MDPPRLEVAEVFRRYQDDYFAAHGAAPQQRRVVRALVACRTAALGGHLRQCDRCGHQEIAYNSCRNRHCPKCQACKQAAWLEAQCANLLDVPYFHVVFKIDGRYYLFLIAWPRGGMRTELVYRADHLDGPWEGRVILADEGIAQGGVIDTPDGDWYALLFGDRGAVGRIPYLVPMEWEDGWPVLGIDGKVPDTLDIPSDGTDVGGIVASEEFDGETLGPAWQWNHNPIGNLWSLTERPGYLRLKTGRTDATFVDTQNTLTQRTFGPTSAASTLLDVTGIRDGDVAGLGILQEDYAFIGVRKGGGAAAVVMVGRVDGEERELGRVPLEGDVVHLRADADFRDLRDLARFSYSLDGTEWHLLGEPYQMRYTLGHFMGARFGLFIYATEAAGRWGDFEYFRVGGSASGGSGR